jgi:hypothetical protein
MRAARAGKLPDAKQWLTEHGFAAAAQVANVGLTWVRRRIMQVLDEL